MILTDDDICRNRYKFLYAQAMEEGLVCQELRESLTKFCNLINDEYYLKTIAYIPTGLALGCPLPNEHFTNQLVNISKQVAGDLDVYESQSFAYVPHDYYHVTLVNYTHFTADKTITKLPEQEFIKAKQTLLQLKINLISIQFEGLILTNHGRLIVPGYPCNEDFYILRNSIVAQIPALRSSLPITAHIKLGHVLKFPKTSSYTELLEDVLTYGNAINTKISFSKIFSPIGEIYLA